MQSWGTPLPGFWKQGEGKIEILIDNNLVLRHTFQIGNEEIVNFNYTNSIENEISNKLTTQQPKTIEHLNKTFFENIFTALSV